MPPGAPSRDELRVPARPLAAPAVVDVGGDDHGRVSGRNGGERREERHRVRSARDRGQDDARPREIAGLESARNRRFGRVGPHDRIVPVAYNRRRMDPLRILIAKPGLDGHDRGAKVVARALRDAGMEVIYTGLRQTPAQIAAAAIQEDVDCVGISILSGAHNVLVPEVIDELAARGGADIPVFVGGIIPDKDIEALVARGVRKIFLPGSSTRDIIAFIQEEIGQRERA